uniref:Uncharacterized protein n=1 Tax=Avena sativa TaxID=4498 RepID=A0ACD5WEL6_AVESA
MDPASCKRQKHETGNDSSTGTQSPSSITSQNRSVCLNFLAQFSDLKHGSVTEDYKAINNKRHEIINTLKKLQVVPIKLPYASPAPKSSGSRLHGASQSENNINSDNIIDLDPDNGGDHVHGNMDNIRAEETTCVVDSDDDDMVISFGYGNSSGNQNANFIQECLLPEQSGQYQDTIMLDDDYCSSEVQLVVKQGMDDMGIDNEPKEIALLDGQSISEPPQQMMKQGHDEINIYNGEKIIRSLVGLKQFSRRSKCNAVSLHPCLKDAQNDNEKNGNTAEDIGSIVRETNINIGAKAKFICELLSLSEVAGEKVLVFSQYVRSLHFLEMLVIRETGWKPGEHIFKINGKSTPDQRNEAVKRFNDSPQAKVLFGSIKACGEGISLVGASRVVILEVHENPSVMRQAIGRAFRPGQSKMVYCYRLVAADSPEEEDHKTAFLKERVSKMWFESNEFSGNDDFELSSVDVLESGDMFLESSALGRGIKSLYKRSGASADQWGRNRELKQTSCASLQCFVQALPLPNLSLFVRSVVMSWGTFSVRRISVLTV